ncbi:MAG: hypothetical protein ACSHWN_04695 [Methylophilaceae bacterium]
MGKRADDSVMDSLLDHLSGTVTKQVLCSAEPTTFTEANVTFALADVTLTSGDFSKANGDVSGRKTTVAAKSGALIDATGNGTHVALLDVANSIVKEVTTCTTQAVTANGTNVVNFPAWDIEVADPT